MTFSTTTTATGGSSKLQQPPRSPTHAQTISSLQSAVHNATQHHHHRTSLSASRNSSSSSTATKSSQSSSSSSSSSSARSSPPLAKQNPLLQSPPPGTRYNRTAPPLCEMCNQMLPTVAARCVHVNETKHCACSECGAYVPPGRLFEHWSDAHADTVWNENAVKYTDRTNLEQAEGWARERFEKEERTGRRGSGVNLVFEEGRRRSEERRKSGGEERRRSGDERRRSGEERRRRSGSVSEGGAGFLRLLAER